MEPPVEPFRVGPPYAPPTRKEEDLTQLEVKIRQWEIKCADDETEKGSMGKYGARIFTGSVRWRKIGILCELAKRHRGARVTMAIATMNRRSLQTIKKRMASRVYARWGE